MGAPIVKEVDRHAETMLLADGSVIPVKHWHAIDGNECDPSDATYCVAGPYGEDAMWYHVDLTLFDLATVH